MIIKQYIFKDILKVQTVTLVVLLSVFLCQTVIKILGQAATGSIPIGVVSEMIIYSLPSIGFILLPMSLYVGIIVSLSRMSSDSEMVVMRSCGLSGVSFMKICMVLSLITATVTALNCLYFMPTSNLAKNALSDSSKNNPRYLPIESGKFTDFGDYTIYIHDVNDMNGEKQLGQVFVIRTLKSKALFSTDFEFLNATSGHMSKDRSGTQWIVLEKGSLYRSDGLSAELEKVDFNTLSIPVPYESDEDAIDDSLESIPTIDLIKSVSNAAKIELQWRIAPIFACFIFSIMAVPLSMINPRQGKFARLGPAIILFVCYYLALLSVRNLLNSEKFPLYPGMYIVPLIFTIFVLIPLNIDRNFLIRKRNK
ncbi:lipopolysaccharide export system permease protein [Succinivibrio dextrinosolvens]|uniref:LPS export ABC transporter permease LptF n=1 Tax=Succinivibrio dextrinosolvens TaxID=83771 RepID=UPI0008E25A8E|nr:LPS export ABC transporter permease LptF [Succinivibrio dextrinosolvens]SFS46335.1 lipopolysaccharide export system permease protein [Succinivibrio dextrinosolvens]